MQLQTTSTYLHSAKRWLGAAAAISVLGISAPAFAQADQQQLVQSAQTTFSDFIRDPDMPAATVIELAENAPSSEELARPLATSRELVACR